MPLISDTPAHARSVSDWEDYFINRDNTREISGHGGGSPLDWFENVFRLHNYLPSEEKQIIYPRMVQAVLNRWTELDAIVRDDLEYDPIVLVAGMAFIRRHDVIDENLRSYYERLWRESPRPHSKTHLIIAADSRGALPVSEVELSLLFGLDGWGMIMARVAFQKGWINLAIELVKQLHDGKDQVSVYDIKKAVEMGFPKLKGLRWMRMLHSNSKHAQFIIQPWEEDLLAEGMTKEEVDA